METMLGILVTYRNRSAHLREFMKHYTTHYPDAFLGIIEQQGNGPFNRGKLFNVGVHYFGFLTHFDLADVDMIPQNRVKYDYPEWPTLLATHVQQFNYGKPYDNYFSGHVLMSREHYIQANGYPNTFQGWGGEDDELYRRVIDKIGRVEEIENGFWSLPHQRAKIDRKLHSQNVERLKAPIDYTDGYNSVQYKVTTEFRAGNYSHIVVKI